jgi:glutaredoxin
VKEIILYLLAALPLIGHAATDSRYFPEDRPYVQTVAGSRYVHVYGRKTCANTARMMRYLKEAGISYRFYSVDEAQTSRRLHDKMRKAGMDVSGYMLPVVDVGGQLVINPSPQSVRAAYSR